MHDPRPVFRAALFSLAALTVVLASGGAPAQNCPPQRDVAPGTCVCPPGTAWRNTSPACGTGRCEPAGPPQCVNGCASGQICVNGACVGNGALRFTLTWDRPGDMDLHVITPVGNEIYYAARSFDQGQLDRDDTTGTGPENVFWPGAPPGGTYQLCVDPYGIQGPTQFQLTVAMPGAPPRVYTGVRNGSERGSCSRGAPNFVTEVTLNGMGPHVGPIVVPPPQPQPATSPAYQWVPGMNGSVPQGAVQGGAEADGTPLFVCRARYYDEGVHPGKVVGANCNIGYGGRELTIPRYEVLVGPPGHWVPARNGRNPPGALVAGSEATGTPLVLCHAAFEGGMHPGKVVGPNCNVGYGGRELMLGNYEVFVP